MVFAKCVCVDWVLFAIDVLLLRHYDAMTILYTTNISLHLSFSLSISLFSMLRMFIREDIHFSGEMIKATHIYFSTNVY